MVLILFGLVLFCGLLIGRSCRPPTLIPARSENQPISIHFQLVGSAIAVQLIIPRHIGGCQVRVGPAKEE